LENRHLTSGPLFVERLISPSSDEILSIDGRPFLLLTDHLEKPLNTEQMLAHCGKPSERLQLGQRRVWKYASSWAAVVERDVVTELWGSEPKE
jgi:hypothetical protein